MVWAGQQRSIPVLRILMLAKLPSEQALRPSRCDICHLSNQLAHMFWPSLPTNLATASCSQISAGIWHWTKKCDDTNLCRRNRSFKYPRCSSHDVADVDSFWNNVR
jgi:hypothetical protein